MTNETTHKVNGNILTLERIFNAPIDLVFEAFTSAEALAQWWSPEGFTIPVSKMDFKVGGTWSYMMKGNPDMGEYANMEMWGLATYKEIDPPKKIVFEDAFCDENGEVNREMPTSLIELNFIDMGEKTQIIAYSSYQTEEDLKVVLDMGMVDGMSSAYTKLDSYLEGQTL